MGNSQSSKTNSNSNADNKFGNFYDIMDYIATYYILTMDFKSLSKLSEKEYCDNLVVLTSDIIERYFTDTEVEYLSQRVKDGVETNEMSKDKIIFLNKDQLDSLDVSNDLQKSIKKKRVCIGIAKFYIKIAHVFSAIVMTINPVYTYKGPDGQTMKTNFINKDTIPKNVPRKIDKMNICDNRIRALRKNEVMNEATGEISMQPKICDMNINKNGKIKSLEEEPGITEFMKLYFDKYDYSIGAFTEMTTTTETQYMRDLKTFYKAFTGNEEFDSKVQKFSDIKLRDYNARKFCQGPDAAFKKSYTINKKDELFVKYAENIQRMINNAASNQSKLLSVINDLFTYVVDPYTKKKKIRINPKLNDQLLQSAVEKTRKFIIDLYIKCEKDYVEGVKLYEAIVEATILETTKNQIDNLKSESEKKVSETEEMKNNNSNINNNFINANNDNNKEDRNFKNPNNPVSSYPGDFTPLPLPPLTPPPQTNFPIYRQPIPFVNNI